ncbi:hypothetical protein KIL84_020619 [Mauremys mutica]|uniref:Uncharacterized protein n=1 Tax=Mauremys mutica TaxID=74926 RepID=A0A9D3XZ17_9SAUR|nr:hypothetical protein KIL84_020619 [Mauremys mutica]
MSSRSPVSEKTLPPARRRRRPQARGRKPAGTASGASREASSGRACRADKGRESPRCRRGGACSLPLPDTQAPGRESLRSAPAGLPEPGRCTAPAGTENKAGHGAPRSQAGTREIRIQFRTERHNSLPLRASASLIRPARAPRC